MKTEISHLRVKAEAATVIDSSSERAIPARVPVMAAGESLASSSARATGNMAPAFPQTQTGLSTGHSETRVHLQEIVATGRENGSEIDLLLLLESALKLVPSIIASSTALESVYINLNSGNNTASAANAQKVHAQSGSILMRSNSAASYTTPSRAPRSESYALKTSLSSTEKATASSSKSAKRGLSDPFDLAISALPSGGSRFSRSSPDQNLSEAVISKYLFRLLA